MTDKQHGKAWRVAESLGLVESDREDSLHNLGARKWWTVHLIIAAIAGAVSFVLLQRLTDNNTVSFLFFMALFWAFTWNEWRKKKRADRSHE